MKKQKWWHYLGEMIEIPVYRFGINGKKYIDNIFVDKYFEPFRAEMVKWYKVESYHSSSIAKNRKKRFNQFTENPHPSYTKFHNGYYKSVF